MKFDNMDNFLKYANSTICVAENKDLPNGVETGMVTTNNGLDGFPVDAKAAFVTGDGRFYKISRVKDWEIYGPKNGYVTHTNGSVFYFERDPKRVWKVGVCSSNSSPRSFWERAPNHRSSIKAIGDLQSKSFAVYTLDDQRVDSKASYALSPRYAVIKGKLQHRGVDIATLGFKTKELIFNENLSKDDLKYHLRNLESRVGSYKPVLFEKLKFKISMKDYDYGFDI